MILYLEEYKILREEKIDFVKIKIYTYLIHSGI